MKRIAIIGGGISGLAAAYFLQQQGSSDLEISLFEASSRLGGVIETENRGGSIFEAGPDCFLSKKPAARDLCRQLGLSQDLIPTREEFRRSFIYSQGKMNQVPSGFYLMAPGKLSTLALLPMISIPGKIRAACDLFLPKKKEIGDESIASFMTRRLGREVFEKIGQPMIGGIYGGDPEKISLLATVPQFAEFERKFGSVIRGLRKQQDEAHGSASGPRYSLFLSLKEGMEQMIHALVKELSAVKIYTACTVTSVIPNRHSGKARWILECADGRSFECEALLIALPAFAASGILGVFSEPLSSELKSIPYESVATVNLLFRKKDVPESFNGVGFVVPKVEGTQLSACTFSSQKFSGRTDSDSALLRAFVGGALYKEAFRLDDRGMEQRVREELKKMLGISARPQEVSIRRYVNAMPQYHLGHVEKNNRIQAALKEFPGIFLCGNAYEGIGIPDCIQLAEKRAAEISNFLS